MPTVYDPLPTDEDWAALTASDRKRAAYAEDLYFREGWTDTVEVLGDRTRPLLDRLAMFAFKADGVAGRRLRPTMDFFARQGFRVVGVAPFQHNRQSMRAIWQYDWHVYPTDRLTLCSLMHAAAPSLLLLLMDDAYDGVVPGTMRLSELKGSSAEKERRPDQLRSVLLPPNRVINFVHIADEPADVVREIAIFFERDARRRLLRQALENADGDLTALALAEIDRLEATNPAHSFDVEETLSRLAAAGTPAEALERLRSARGSAEKLRWDQLAAICDPSAPNTDVWDFVLLASEVLEMERPGYTGTMPAPLSSDWRMRAQRSAPVAR